jgi:hypothetical protein
MTTLNKILSKGPCEGGWYNLLQSLNKTQGDDEPLSLVQIFKSNGLDDAIWALRTIEGRDKEIRLFAVSCARQVQHLMTDPRSLHAIEVAERFANGQVTNTERRMTRAQALDAIADAEDRVKSYAAGAAFHTLGLSAATSAYLTFEMAKQTLSAVRKSNKEEHVTIARIDFRLKQGEYFLTMVSSEDE